MTDPDVTRQTAHVLLDAMSAFDDLASPDPEPAVQTALRRLNDIGAVTSVYDEMADARRVDIKPVLQASLNLLTALVVMELHENPNRTAIDIITELRTATDLTAGL